MVVDPFKQMAIEHRRDSDIFLDFAANRNDPTLWDSHGQRMWYIATTGMNIEDSRRALGKRWCEYLEQKYP